MTLLRITSVALAFIAVALNSLASDLPTLIAQVKTSVVGIGTTAPALASSPKKPMLKFTGTGLVVGDGRQVVTNLHVVSMKINKDNGESLAIFSGIGKKAQVRSAKIIRVDAAHDLALLAFSGPPLPPLELSDNCRKKEGTAIAFTGFPIGVVLGLYPVTHRGIIAAVTPFVGPAHSSKSLTAEQVLAMRKPFFVYQLDATAYPGNSGSAVYDANSGRVIGVLNAVFVKGVKESALTDPSGMTYAVPVEYVRKLLAP